MGMYQFDLVLCLDNDEEGYPRLRSTSPLEEPQNMIRLNELITNPPSTYNHITILSIPNCEITELPNTVQMLNLKQLILSHNKLAEVPYCLYSGLNSLELLDLSHNLLTNFDITPACCDTIVKLKVEENQIENFPEWILTVRCPKLAEVCYKKNFLMKLNPTRELTVQKLEMSNCQLLDFDFIFFKRIKTLEFLDISNDLSGVNENRFTEINGLFNQTKWKKLLVLKLNNLVLSVIPQGIFSHASIVELHLVQCELNWIPQEIQQMQNLEILDISRNSICSLPKYVTALEKLSIIKAPLNCISTVGEFTNDLELLDLYNNELEKLPISIDRVKLIDLEQNYLDTSLFGDEYSKKRGEFRGTLEDVRTHGRRFQVLSASDYSESEASLDDVGDDSGELHYVDSDECWDEEKPNAEIVKNEAVTTSDDEWTGIEDLVKKRPKTVVIDFDNNEDWFFQDAEED